MPVTLIVWSNDMMSSLAVGEPEPVGGVVLKEAVGVVSWVTRCERGRCGAVRSSNNMAMSPLEEKAMVETACRSITLGANVTSHWLKRPSWPAVHKRY